MNARSKRIKNSDHYDKSAERAFRRVAIKVRAEYKRHGMKPAVWPVEK